MGSKFVQKAAVLLLLSSLSVAARFTEQLTVAGGGCKEAFFAQLGHSFRYQAYISSASDLVGCIRLSKLFVHGDCVTSRSNIFGVQLIRCTSCRPVGNAMPSTCRSVFLHGSSDSHVNASQALGHGAFDEGSVSGADSYAFIFAQNTCSNLTAPVTFTIQVDRYEFVGSSCTSNIAITIFVMLLTYGIGVTWLLCYRW